MYSAIFKLEVKTKKQFKVQPVVRVSNSLKDADTSTLPTSSHCMCMCESLALVEHVCVGC